MCNVVYFVVHMVIQGYNRSQVLKLVYAFDIVGIHGYVLSIPVFISTYSLSDMHIFGLVLVDREAYLPGLLLYVQKHLFCVNRSAFYAVNVVGICQDQFWALFVNISRPIFVSCPVQW